MTLSTLTDTDVRAIKVALIRGTHPTILAQMYGVNAETIRRIKRGETHNRIRVEGEEILRPGMVVLPLARMTGQALVVPESTEEQKAADEESAKRVLRMVEEMKKGKTAPSSTEDALNQVFGKSKGPM